MDDTDNYRLSVREWHVATNQAVGFVTSSEHPDLLSVHRWLLAYAAEYGTAAPPPIAYLQQKLAASYAEHADLGVGEIGFNVTVPALPAGVVHKIALLYYE